MNTVRPIVALLRENWRLTRIEVAQRFGLGLAVGGAAMTWLDAGATAAFWLLLWLNALIWFSIAKLNGGRFADGYKPGFPLHLLFARPVPTAMFVGVAMVYDAVSCVALYLVSAALLGFAFGQPLPLFSVALWLLTCHFAYACVQWSTRSRTVQWVGSIAFSLSMFFVIADHATPTTLIDFSLIANAVMVLACIVAFVLTVEGVSRQRRGDAVATASAPKATSGGYPDLLVSLFRFRCPTSSATKAQAWFEFKSSGLPVLTIGLVTAFMIFVLLAISSVVVPARNIAVPLAIVTVPIALFALGNNAFGIRRKQGRTYGSAFELTQPFSTARFSGLKLLVRTACVLVALIAIAASLWASSSLMETWGAWLPDGKKDALPDLLNLRSRLQGIVGGLTGYAYAALAVVASITVAHVVAWKAMTEALRARHPRILLVAQWLPAVWGLSIIALTLAARRGFGPRLPVGEIVNASFWITGAAMAFLTIYLVWSGFVGRVLTMRYASAALAMSVAFAAAWSTGITAGSTFGITWLALAVLMVSILAPWSLGRVRHA